MYANPLVIVQAVYTPLSRVQYVEGIYENHLFCLNKKLVYNKENLKGL